MENFNITVNGKEYTIFPQDNGTYRIMSGEEKTGVIYAEPTDDGAEWRTLDELDEQFVNEAGRLITENNS